ncbi:MAG: hypothetical protein RIM84_10390 [Alphaproteobacteria bacterium]
MRKALVLGLLGLFVASNGAMACGWGKSKSASSGSQQTVMTDQAKPASDGG